MCNIVKTRMLATHNNIVCRFLFSRSTVAAEVKILSLSVPAHSIGNFSALGCAYRCFCIFRAHSGVIVYCDGGGRPFCIESLSLCQNVINANLSCAYYNYTVCEFFFLSIFSVCDSPSLIFSHTFFRPFEFLSALVCNGYTRYAMGVFIRSFLITDGVGNRGTFVKCCAVSCFIIAPRDRAPSR